VTIVAISLLGLLIVLCGLAVAVAGAIGTHATVRPGCIALAASTRRAATPVLVTGVVLAVGSFALEWMLELILSRVVQ
jgi:hypothetical protein